MKTVIDLLQEKISAAILEAYPEGERFLPADMSQSTQEYYGHYQCNSALRIGKMLKENPRGVAQTIVDAISQDEIFERVEIAGPGFINFTLTAHTLSDQLNAMLGDDRLGVAKPKLKQRVVVDFSSPNIAKELHVGHLRSTIIGESLARMLAFIGYDVLRLNHVGDWGTQFGMLIAYLKKHQPKILSSGKGADLASLMRWYRESKKEFDDNEEFKLTAQKEVVALQARSPDSIAAWEKICEISRQGFSEVYELLDVKIEERGESFYNQFLPDVIKDLENLGLIEESKGAKCIFLEGFKGKDGTPLPMIVQKSDGGYNYSTTDLATIRHRINVEKADRIIYVVDAGQSLHFKMLFSAAEKAGWLDPSRVDVEHVTFGVVLGSDGKKFKTRSGETERLIDLLQNAINKATDILDDRMKEATRDEVKETARILGIDAVKYADLSCQRIKDYVFSYDRMLRFEGNTAAFLLYAFVRIQGIKRRVGGDCAGGEIVLAHPSEISLGLHLRRFAEALSLIDRDLLPNRLCDYLFTLAEKFNAFYRDCPVDGADEEESRLSLCDLTARVLEKGLYLLGLQTVARM
jgi:arginyl-tRNA synthetase